MSKLEKFLRGRFAAALVAILVGFAVAAVVLTAAGFNPAASFAALFQGALGKPKYIANVIIKATPILLTGVGVAFAFPIAWGTMKLLNALRARSATRKGL